MHGRIGRDAVAHRPVTPIDNAVRAEQLAQGLERGPIVRRIIDERALHPAHDVGNFREHVGSAPELEQRGPHRRWVSIPLAEREVIDHDAQARQQSGKLQRGLENRGPTERIDR